MPPSLPTQELLHIERIERDALILMAGGLRKILLVSGLNFELRSEEEQNALLGGYQNFLNALNFSLQIFIHSRKINIDPYVQELGALEQQETNELLGAVIGEYRAFIASLVAQNPIMEKRFFAVVPYDPPLALPQVSKAVTDTLFGLFKKKTAAPPPDEEAPDEPPKKIIDDAAFIQLGQRTDQIINGLSQLGLRAVPLNNDELTELFYNLYNPETIERHVVPNKESGIRN